MSSEVRRLSAFASGLAILFSGCGTPSAPSALQNFDRLKGQMKKTTSTSGKVAMDLKLVNTAMQWNNTRHVRQLTIRLKSDAGALMRLAGRTGNKIRALASRTHAKPANGYFKLAVATLAWQWKEGDALKRLADLVWSDPLIMGTRDENRLWRISRSADWSAWRAVLDSRRMAHWRKIYASQLRYERVK